MAKPNFKRSKRSNKRRPRILKIIATNRMKNPKPNAQDYDCVLGTFGDTVESCAETDKGTMILIRPKKKKDRWIIETGCLGFLPHPDEVICQALTDTLADTSGWAQ